MATPPSAGTAPMPDVAAVLRSDALVAPVQPVTTTPPSASVGPRSFVAGETALTATTPPPRVAVTPALAAAAPAAKPAKREGPPPRRVSLWNVVYRRRICGARPFPKPCNHVRGSFAMRALVLRLSGCRCAGNSAPMEHNLAKYLAKHPECEVYCGQDVHGGKGTGETGDQQRVEVVVAKPRKPAGPIQKRVTLWHKVQKRKVVGNAAPLEKNVHTYLAKHPEYEVYDAHGHEREKDIQRAVEKVMTAIVTSVAALNRDLEEKNRSTAPSRKRKPQVKLSGGKRPKEGPTRKASTAKSAKLAAAEEEEQQQGQCTGLSFLLHIASGGSAAAAISAGPEAEAEAEAEEHGMAAGLLDLLAAVRPEPAQLVFKLAAAAALLPPIKESPESPPFSPMMQPTQGESAKMEVLSLAPSPVRTATNSFHRLS